MLACGLTAGCATPSVRTGSLRPDWIHETPGPGRSETLLIVLHGTKAGPEDEALSWRAAARRRGWDLLSYGHPDADVAQAPRIHRDLQSIVRRLERQRGASYKTLRYAGSSRGGRIAVAVAGLSRATAVVSMAGTPEQVSAARSETRVLLVYGQEDPTPDPDRRQAERALREAGYGAVSRTWPGQGHLLGADAYEHAADWLEAGTSDPQGQN